MKEKAQEAHLPESEFLYDNLNTAEVKKIEGYEYAAGAGLSATLAQAHYRSIMIMFNQAFHSTEPYWHVRRRAFQVKYISKET